MIETGIIGLIALALVIVFGGLVLLRSMKKFLINALVGIAILIVANNIAGLGIGYSWPVILICAIGGALGAMLIIALHYIGIAVTFTPFS
jgi:hypothetical protein